MFEQLLGQMLSGGFGRQRKRRSNRGFGLSTSTKTQLGVGALGLAVAAWEHFKGKSDAPGAQPALATARHSLPPPLPPAFAPAPAATNANDREADASHLIRSMIAAAHADGAIDAVERAAILERAMEAGLDAATQKFLMGELRAPATLDQIVAATPETLRMETYAAALIAISVDTEAERAYLDRLAQALRLDAADRQRVQEQVGA